MEQNLNNKLRLLIGDLTLTNLSLQIQIEDLKQRLEQCSQGGLGKTPPLG